MHSPMRRIRSSASEQLIVTNGRARFNPPLGGVALRVDLDPGIW